MQILEDHLLAERWANPARLVTVQAGELGMKGDWEMQEEGLRRVYRSGMVGLMANFQQAIAPVMASSTVDFGKAWANFAWTVWFVSGLGKG
jgi:hypothetical protein